MPKRKSYAIAGLHFNSQTELREYIRSILHKYPLGAKLNAADSQFALALLELHPDKVQKKGSGVVSISVGGTEWDNRCFYVHRTDGSYDDFTVFRYL